MIFFYLFFFLQYYKIIVNFFFLSGSCRLHFCDGLALGVLITATDCKCFKHKFTFDNDIVDFVESSVISTRQRNDSLDAVLGCAMQNNSAVFASLQ